MPAGEIYKVQIFKENVGNINSGVSPGLFFSNFLFNLHLKVFIIVDLRREMFTLVTEVIDDIF